MKECTRKEAEENLNEIGCPDHDLRCLGGRVPDRMSEKYGTWLRRNDPIAFEVYLYELRLDSKERRGYGKAQRVNNVPGRRV